MFLAARLPVRAAGNTRVAPLSTPAAARLSPVVLGGRGRVHLPRRHKPPASCQQRRTFWSWLSRDKDDVSPEPFTGPPPTPLAKALREQDLYGDRIAFTRPRVGHWGRELDAMEAVRSAIGISGDIPREDITRHLVPFWTVVAFNDVGYRNVIRKSRKTWMQLRTPTFLSFAIAAVGKDHWAHGAMLFADLGELHIAQRAENTTTPYLDESDRARCWKGKSAKGHEGLDSAPQPFVLGPPTLDRATMQGLYNVAYLLGDHGFKQEDFRQSISSGLPPLWETFTVDRQPVVRSVPHYRLIYKTEYRGETILVDATERGVEGTRHDFNEQTIALMPGNAVVPTDGESEGDTWTPALSSKARNDDDGRFLTGIVASAIPAFHKMIMRSMTTAPRWPSDTTITPYDTMDVMQVGEDTTAAATNLPDTIFDFLLWVLTKFSAEEEKAGPPPKWVKPAPSVPAADGSTGDGSSTPPQPDVGHPIPEPTTDGGRDGATVESTTTTTAGGRQRGRETSSEEESSRRRETRDGGSGGPTLRRRRGETSTPKTATQDQRAETSTPKKKKESGVGGGRTPGGVGGGGEASRSASFFGHTTHRQGRSARLQQSAASAWGAQARRHSPLASRAKLQATASVARRPRPVTVTDTKGYYAELGLEPTADWLDKANEDEVDAIIKERHLALIKKFHPDRVVGLPEEDEYNERTKLINYASDIIETLKGRLDYQAGRAR